MILKEYKTKKKYENELELITQITQSCVVDECVAHVHFF